MQQYDSDVEQGLIYGYLLDGRGGGRRLSRRELEDVEPSPNEVLWLHWDRSVPEAQAWLRQSSGLSEFACDLLLEEATRPRLVTQPDDSLLLFLRGVNLNPGAVPEDMVSLRVFVEKRRVISLRMRPMKAAAEVQEDIEAGIGAQSAEDLVLYLASYMTSRVDDLVRDLSEQLDSLEEQSDQDDKTLPDHGRVLALRRRATGLRRYLAPQRDIYADLSRGKPAWFVATASQGYWSELHNSLVRNLEELELMRERVALLQEAEQRATTERTNRTLYLLAIITGFFLPISFITGLLGMNMGGLPGSSSPFGFLAACLLIGAVAVFQVWLFRRLRWL